jgi:hypothetical protein
MLSHRANYLRTVLVSSFVTIGGLALLLFLVREALDQHGSLSFPKLLLLLTVGLVLFIVKATGLMVITGGLISLRRDSLETRSLSYAARRPQQWRVGPFARTFFQLCVP